MHLEDPKCGYRIGDDDYCDSTDTILISVQVRGNIGQVVSCPEHAHEAAEVLVKSSLVIHQYGFEMIEQMGLDQENGIAFGGF